MTRKFLVFLILCSVAFASQTSIALAAQTQHSVTLNWGASVTPGVAYNVYRSTTPGACGTTKVGSGIAAVTFNDTTVVNGATYNYAISAQNAGGESACSNEVQAVIPSPPSPPGTLAQPVVK